MSCPFKHLAATSASPPSPTGVADKTALLNKLVVFMQRSADAAFLLDAEGTIIFRNKAAQLMFLTNVNQMNFCSLFSSTRGDCWDSLARNLQAGDPSSHDVTVIDEKDGSALGFRVSLVKLSPEMMGDEDTNNDVFACAYVTPAHDHENTSSSSSRGPLGKVDSMDRCIHKIIEDVSDHYEGHMKDVVEACGDPMFSVFEDGTIGTANGYGAHMFGYSQEELSEMNISSICPVVRDIQKIAQCMNGSAMKHHEQKTTALHKSGRSFNVDMCLSLNNSFAGSEEPVYFAHFKDLSAFEDHETELEHKDNLCQAMCNASFDPMFSIDQTGTILVVNDAACSMFGYSREEFINNNISMICNEKDSQSHDKYMERYLRTGKRRVIGIKRPLVARRKDGSEFHIELGVSEVNLPDGKKVFCGYVRDRTQERLDKQMIRRRDAVIKDEFFTPKKEDVRGAMKRNLERATQ
ncbi:PAS domain-containing protein [Skeletonema marinoi]|uniref:PAS domain-containing protein n=1 Tax=Skeletonema marinoi TaxID=267567 RepID=A0AAD8XVX1_9STRA|nr:PAS domain-containing protein [Skeletonema marinoi]